MVAYFELIVGLIFGFLVGKKYDETKLMLGFFPKKPIQEAIESPVESK